MLLDASTTIDTVGRGSAVEAAAADLARDLMTVCAGVAPDTAAAAPLPRRSDGAMDDAVAPAGAIGRIELKDTPGLGAEMFRITADARSSTLTVEAGDELGFVHGLYHISRELLGVPDFWFWMDWTPEQTGPVEIPDDYRYESRPYAVAERGWFVNDEILLMDWQLGNDPDLPWQMVFEALLRCGGNMVIPGTGNNAARHARAASARGLAIAQHHAEPLGARPFSSAYPDLDPSWDRHRDLFEGLWRESIEAHRGQHVIWNVGFRGQGDAPFWNSDPSYDTDAKRGALISEIIRIQRRMVTDADPTARCCAYLYGETLELYRKGVLDIPDDVIKVWSDNGYGRMVTRRQDNHDPRIDAMPNPADHGAQGIYYHASFYDLQAATHVTTLPSDPAHVTAELGQVLRRGGDAFWVINSSNVKPHVYYLDLIARLWREGETAPAGADGAPASGVTATAASSPAEAPGDDPYLSAAGLAEAQTAVDRHLTDYTAAYYGPEKADAAAAAESHRAYFHAATHYGRHWDNAAGDQYFNHCPRILANQFIRDHTGATPAEGLAWAAPTAHDLTGQIDAVDHVAETAAEAYGTLADRNTAAAVAMRPHARRLFDDSIAMHAQVLARCAQGTHLACVALRDGLREDWQHAFWRAGLARREFRRARAAMLGRGHGRWHGFYHNEGFADIEQSAWTMSQLMGFLRQMGDGPVCYQWQRDFIYSKEERKVTTLLTLEKHLDDDELFEAMLVTWEDTVA
ncbi:glycosyl hydrolase 115 family protein [Bifidobacterium pullorum subsp. saeculare]|uniref:Glycosyl hydrolase 115 family protein n=1 Tax=Bifidobacterium pullorum subsp. saeculare TaxID=78257 RepID=A0A938WXZ1_9BIFI|nr:glycosyl hydrolase 115 family protein [Bifidobacterium pullorum]MBM6699961.1 glycosyl hydrolase 115 family protein [Bifidobacterium pullorum subsp. saeculare]